MKIAFGCLNFLFALAAFYMTSIVASETSLFELVAGASTSPIALHLSPVTFKALLSGLIDLMIDQHASATVWAKLPKGETWQAELDRYCEASSLSERVYTLKNQRDEIVEAASSYAVRSAPKNGNGDTASLVQSSMIGVAVPLDSPLRREYFLLVWSQQFCALLIAHRPRSVVTLREGDPVTQIDVDEAGEKKQTLTAFLVLDPATVERAIVALQPLTNDAIDLPNSAIDPTIVNQLVAKHIQRQEELWQRGSLHRRQAETANLLQLQNEELLSTIRLKDEFLNNVGQELRTPLTTIKTALTLLNSPNLKPPQRQRYMDLLVKECDRQSSLITSLLDLVNLDQMAEQTTIQALQVIDVVPGVVSTYQPLAEEKGVRLAYTVPEKLPTIACLNTWLKQIVINLLHNGIKFTPRGGQVWVRAKQQGDYVQLEFRDTGIGIAPGEIPKIFDRFYRVRQVADDGIGGAGLGLTIVQKLLLHCGGSISVKSRLGEGTTFNVLLPIYRISEEKAEA